MKTSNKVYIGTSLDGYIADKDGNIDFLESIAIPEDTDMGYFSFVEKIDALVMGRTTFETVLSFDVEWPYDKPVFVLSNSLKEVPESLKNKAIIVNGTMKDVLNIIHQKGYYQLYIDGGKTIQSFLQEDLIDELIITVIPILIGSGKSLFGELPSPLLFECVETKLIIDKIVQNRYIRKR